MLSSAKGGVGIGLGCPESETLCVHGLDWTRWGRLIVDGVWGCWIVGEWGEGGGGACCTSGMRTYHVHGSWRNDLFERNV